MPPIPTDRSLYLLEMRRAQIVPIQTMAYPLGMLGTLEFGVGEDQVSNFETVETPIYFSDGGWTGEPTDADRPNAYYPSRMLSKPTIQRSIPINPRGGVREARQGAEITLDNQDKAIAALSGQWSVAGRRVRLLRGEKNLGTSKPYSSFTPIGEFTATGAPYGQSIIRLQMNASIPALGNPVCPTFTGDGASDGTAEMAGQNKPILIGVMRLIVPIMVWPAKVIFMISGRAVQDVQDVLIQGMPVNFKANYATPGELANATMSNTTQEYATCNAAGLIRFSFVPAGKVTLAAGSAEGYTLSNCFNVVLFTIGGVSPSLLDTNYFQDPLFNAQAGFYFKDGTIEEAVDEIMASVGGWWGVNALGKIYGGTLGVPEQMPVNKVIETWMLDTAPDQSEPLAPTWQERVEYSPVVEQLSETDVVPAAGAATRLRLTSPRPVSSAGNPAVRNLYPKATNPEPLKGAFFNKADADTLANQLFLRYGTPREIWMLVVGVNGHDLDLGHCVLVTYGPLMGRKFIVVGKGETGDSVTLTVWG